MRNQELEVKFYLADRKAMEYQLSSPIFRVKQPRNFEMNLRFDTTDLQLSNLQKVLRLRKDQKVTITYKGPGDVVGGVRRRKEIEIIVEDFDNAKDLFEALGYHVIFIYEKFRTTYKYQKTTITLDEMPYGDFLEIEGSNPANIKKVSNILGLDWEMRILDSYTMLFEIVKKNCDLNFRDLRFENFKSTKIVAEDLGVQPAF